MKNIIQTFFRQNNDFLDKMTINDFKKLVIEDLIEFVLTQDPKEKLEDCDWAERYSDWLIKK